MVFVKKLLKIVGYSTVVLLILAYFLFVLPFWGIPFNAQRHGNPPLTPAWALECWLWEDDKNTAAYEDSLLAGYAKHDIPVRTLLIDSPWSLRYNDFEVDTLRYPKPAQWFKGLEEKGYRVVLWMTSMVDSYSKDTRLTASQDFYQNAKQRGYLVGNGNEIKWWKGKGGFIDYANPDARKWWQGLQKNVLQYGIDGWKLDGTATLFRQQIGFLPFLYQKTHSGWMSTRQYMDWYYREEYANGLRHNPEFVTLGRAMDRWFHPEGFAPIDASPVNWVGDQKHHWRSPETLSSNGKEKDIALDGVQGFESAIQSILRSAKRGYNVIGSDIAGFSGDSIPPRLYIRWAQFSTFCGLFLNGGHGERALWKRSAQELDIIRRFSWLHTELLPYMYSYVVSAHRGGARLQQPTEGKYHYMFGDHLLVAPIYQDQLDNEVTLPAGKWRYWFNDHELLEGNTKFTKTFPLEEFPVYIKEGSIIPLRIERAYTGIGDSTSRNYLTWLVYPAGSNEFSVYDPQNQTPTTLRVAQHATSLTLSLTGKHLPHILAIHAAKAPKTVTLDGKSITFRFDERKQKLYLKTDTYSVGNYQIDY